MNPSSWGPRILVALLALVATLISFYLGLYQWGVLHTVWDPFFGEGTKKVLTSNISHEITKWVHLPDAILGALAYFSDVLFALAGSKERWKNQPWLVILFGIDIIPLGLASTLLVFLQGFVIKSWCFLCLITACISFSLVFISYGEVAASIQYLHEIWKKTRSSKALWQAFWGKRGG